MGAVHNIPKKILKKTIMKKENYSKDAGTHSIGVTYKGYEGVHIPHFLGRPFTVVTGGLIKC